MTGMEERIRITFDVPDRVRRALNINAARTDRSVGEVIEEIVLQVLGKDISLADESIATGKPPPRVKPGRKGRKPKAD